MFVDVQRDEPLDMTPDHFFAGLQAAARYIIDSGLPFFTSSHISFMSDYLEAWRKQSGAEAVAKACADLQELKKQTRHNLSPVVAQLGGFLRSVFGSAWMVLGNSIRFVPPLITAVVVVFVTSDGWRILGTGFTPRSMCLVVLFLVTSLLFLVRFKGYWEDDWDISASNDIQEALLSDIRSEMGGDHEADRRTHGAPRDERDEFGEGARISSWQQFKELIDCGAKTVPLVKPLKLGGRVCLYGGYLAVSASSLIVVALVVSASLILVGLILISAKETSALAQSAHIYWVLPGHLVITRELVSLSVCLGALAVLFLVTGQRTEAFGVA